MRRSMFHVLPKCTNTLCTSLSAHSNTSTMQFLAGTLMTTASRGYCFSSAAHPDMDMAAMPCEWQLDWSALESFSGGGTEIFTTTPDDLAPSADPEPVVPQQLAPVASSSKKESAAPVAAPTPNTTTSTSTSEAPFDFSAQVANDLDRLLVSENGEDKSFPSTTQRFDREQLHSVSKQFVVGTDEAGRGPIYGPVVAAACWVAPHVTNTLFKHGQEPSTEPSVVEEIIEAPVAPVALTDDEQKKLDAINERRRKKGKPPRTSLLPEKKKATKKKAATPKKPVALPAVGDSKGLTKEKRLELFHRLTGYKTSDCFFDGYTAVAAGKKLEQDASSLNVETTTEGASNPTEEPLRFNDCVSYVKEDKEKWSATHQHLGLKDIAQLTEPTIIVHGGATNVSNVDGSVTAVPFPKKKVGGPNDTQQPDIIWALAIANAAYIDRGNILSSALDCMAASCRAVADNHPEMKTPTTGSARKVLCLIDGNQCPPKPQMPKDSLVAPVVKGDVVSFTIGAASIIAKCARDHLTTYLGKEVHPGYGIENHHGYGCAPHLKNLRAKGVTPLHRMTFAPCKSLLSRADAEAIEKKRTMNKKLKRDGTLATSAKKKAAKKQTNKKAVTKKKQGIKSKVASKKPNAASKKKQSSGAKKQQKATTSSAKKNKAKN